MNDPFVLTLIAGVLFVVFAAVSAWAARALDAHDAEMGDD